MTMRTAVSKQVIVEPGEYFLGDPCYAVPNEHWMNLLESCSYFGMSADELGPETAAKCGAPSPVGKADGHDVLAFSTAHGDGEYYDQWGTAYPVDAGLIGLTPVALIKDRADVDGLGQFVTFTAPAVCRADSGTLEFGDYVIDTDVCETEDDDDEW